MTVNFWGSWNCNGLFTDFWDMELSSTIRYHYRTHFCSVSVSILSALTTTFCCQRPPLWNSLSSYWRQMQIIYNEVDFRVVILHLSLYSMTFPGFPGRCSGCTVGVVGVRTPQKFKLGGLTPTKKLKGDYQIY